MYLLSIVIIVVFKVVDYQHALRYILKELNFLLNFTSYSDVKHYAHRIMFGYIMAYSLFNWCHKLLIYYHKYDKNFTTDVPELFF